MVANVNRCGALHIKTSLWGQWNLHLGCNTATSAAIAPNGQTIAIVRADNTLFAKSGLWGQWLQHVGIGDSKATALAS
jgi:hypothetical protein